MYNINMKLLYTVI